MEFLEAVPVFSGWDYCFFHDASYDSLCNGSFFLPVSFYPDSFYYCQETYFRGPCIRLAVFGLHHTNDQWSAVFLHWNLGTISCQNIYGGKKTAYLSGEGEALRKAYEKKFQNLNEILAAKTICDNRQLC